MTQANTLKELTYTILRFVGNGYISYKIVYIPFAKIKKKEKILNKIKEAYSTNQTQGQRQYKRIKKKSNYQAINFNRFIIIFRTSGENKDKENEFKKIDLHQGLNLKISDFLELILFKPSESEKLTYRISKECYANFKGELEKSIEFESYIDFKMQKEKYRNLPIYKGIGTQKKELNKFLRILYKNNRNCKAWGLI